MATDTEIESARATTHLTRRNTVHALEDILYLEHDVLDHGFVRVIDYMGDDAAIVQAARVSYGSGTKSARDDRSLIRHLMRNRHSSPIEMCEIKLHIKLPIFVARQWIRHRTANVNEHSARYSILDKEFYVPEPEQLAMQSQTNKQGRGDVLQGDDAQRVLQILTEDAARSYDHYREMEDTDGIGLARELARINLPVNIYTQWYWKIDLHNLLHFLSLRADPHAQHEIRVYADIIFDMVKAWVPVAAEAFEDYVVGGAHISRAGLVAIRRMIAGEDIEDIAGASGMSDREWVEFVGKLRVG